MTRHPSRFHFLSSSRIRSLAISAGKWLLLTCLVGVLAGSAAAIFLLLLDWVTSLREAHIWLIALLPAGGLIIGLLYHYFGSEVVKGNNLLIEEFHAPEKPIPFIMVPLVLAGTLLTHLFGGSAGREGTAVQMGGAIADQFTHFFRLPAADRRLLIITGIAAGFAAVFGTPLAGAVFAIEILATGRTRYLAVLPALLAAFIAHYTCMLWPITHTHYTIHTVPSISATALLWTAFAGILFGLTAMVFSYSTHFWTAVFRRYIKYPPLRPFAGGILLAAVILSLGTTKYIGLGIPTIVAAFSENMNSYDFLLKILFTSFTLGAGFKGGEVTPLFFIGAVLGNALVWLIPLPLPLLAGMGFTAVFAGATHSPVASAIMGIELFGTESAVYLAVACMMAYFFSGLTGIYSAQKVTGPKRHLYNHIRR